MSNLRKIIQEGNVNEFKTYIDDFGHLGGVSGGSGFMWFGQLLTSYFDLEDSKPDDSLTQMLQYLIQKGVDFNHFDDVTFSPIFYLIDANKSFQLKLILDAGASIEIFNDEYETPIIRATLYEFENVLEVLLDYKIDGEINKAGSYLAKTPLGIALYKKNIRMVELLLKAGADPFIEDNDMVATILSIPKDADRLFIDSVQEMIKIYYK